jgi:hypothetical protein
MQHGNVANVLPHAFVAHRHPSSLLAGIQSLYVKFVRVLLALKKQAFTAFTAIHCVFSNEIPFFRPTSLQQLKEVGKKRRAPNKSQLH